MRITVFSIGLLLALAAVAAAQVTFTEFPLPAGSGSPQGIAAGPDGAVWFTEFDFTRSINKIGRIAQNGALSEFPRAAGSGPQGITAGPDGALWFTQILAGKIGRISSQGAFTEYPVPASLALPAGIAAGPDGALWFTEGGAGNIGRITTAGAVTEFPVPTAFSGPNGIAKGPDGALWFTESFAGNIGRITTAGIVTEFPLPNGLNGQDITAGPDGNLWFTEQNNDAIGRITPSGVVTMFPAPAGSHPYGIAAGPDGALWFAATGINQVGRITTAGAIAWSSVPTAASGVQGIVKGPDGALWFTERGSDRIGRAALPAGVFPPATTAAFGAAAIPLNGSTSLSFTLTNSNTVALNGVGFTANLSAGLSVATPNGLTGTCGVGGSMTNTPASVTLAGGAIAAGGSCTFSVNVTGTAAGTQGMTTGAVTSTNGGAGTPASASVTVTGAQAPDLTAAVSHAAGFSQGQTGASIAIAVTNSGAGPTTGSVSVIAKPAASLTPTAIGGAGWTCSLSSLTCTRADVLPAGGSYSVIAMAVNVPANAPSSVTNSATVAGGGELNIANDSGSDLVPVQPVVSATVTTSPAGLSFTIDGVTFSSPQSLAPGSSHTIATKASQQGGTGAGYVFRSWSDGGALSHTVTAAGGITYTANFDAQYPLTIVVNPPGAGTVAPASGLFTAGTVVNLQATPAPGYKFVSWTGPVSATAAAATGVAMTGPLTVTANFAAQSAASSATTSPAGLSFSVDGITYTSAQSIAGGSPHTIATRTPQAGAAGIQYVFKVWSDGGAISHTVTPPTASTTYTASFDTQYQLTVAVSPAGSGTVTPASGFFAAGSDVTLQATPAPGFSFAGWTGSSATAATTSVRMTGPVSMTANFKTSLTTQTIDFPALSNRTQGDPPTVLSATATSGLPVTFTIVSGPASINGNILTTTGLGSVVVQASQSGSAKFAAATPVNRGFSVLSAGSALTLAANPPEGGTIAATPAGAAAGSTVRVEAQPNSGFLFTGFTGMVSGLVNPQSVLVAQAGTVTANFANISSDPADQFTFALTKGNSLPDGQTASGLPVLVIPGTGGDWLVAAPGTSATALLSLNAAVVSNLKSGAYVSYVLATSSGQQRVLTVRLMIDAVSITGVMDGAGFRPSLASQEMATAFGFNQAVDARLATVLPLETTLGGTTLTITDSTGVARAAQLLYVSSNQVNFVTPADMAPGAGVLEIANSTGQKGTMPVTIDTAAPGLFSADQNGKGIAAAAAQTYAADGTVSGSLAARCGGAGPCSPIAIDVSNPADQVFLSLYGTGIRGASGLAAVSVTVGGVPVDVLFAGAQPQFPGLDQVNVKLSPALAGKGDAAVKVTVDGHVSNTVTIRIR
jgi:virginiamycin B lyase